MTRRAGIGSTQLPGYCRRDASLLSVTSAFLVPSWGPNAFPPSNDFARPDSVLFWRPTDALPVDPVGSMTTGGLATLLSEVSDGSSSKPLLSLVDAVLL
jgi:hypothetical protein